MPSSSQRVASPLRIAFVLWLIAMPGVVGVVWMVLPQLLRGISDAPPLWLAMSASFLQSAVLLAAAAWGGAKLAPKVGLSSPLLFSLTSSPSAGKPSRCALVAGLLGGVAGGLFLMAATKCAPQEFLNYQSRITLSLAWRILYGGITEEVLLRWGLMSALAWLAWRLLQGGVGTPRAACFYIALFVSAVLFGVGHLPAVAAQAGSLSPLLVSYVIVANSALGLLFGYLFWRNGLEAAIIAHATAHLLAYLAP